MLLQCGTIHMESKVKYQSTVDDSSKIFVIEQNRC